MRTFLGTFFLRVGISFALFYPAIMSFINPDKWAIGLPQILTQFANAKTILIIIAGYEILLGIIILIKPDPFLFSVLVFLTFAALAFLSREFDQAYINITVALAALSLSFLGKIKA